MNGCSRIFDVNNYPSYSVAGRVIYCFKINYFRLIQRTKVIRSTIKIPRATSSDNVI